jgi:hypothetical protein
MKSMVKVEPKHVRRDLFGELREGIAALAESRQGKRILRTHPIEDKPAPSDPNKS